MINSILIENFQSHKSSILELDAGMNVIVGKSDSGKTAIIRALKWAINNKPGGDEFRSIWGGDTSVIIKTKEGFKVTRVKKNNYNGYLLNDLEFLAFGQDVPEEIAKAMNMDSINLQQQLDSIFLLGDTSGNIATHFNKIAKLDKIDRGLQNVQKEINTISQDTKYIIKTIDSKKLQLKSFDNLDAFEKDLIIIEKLEEQKIKLNTDQKILIVKVASIEHVQKQIEIKSKALVNEKLVDEILGLMQARNAAREKYKALKKLSISIYNTNQDIKKAEIKISMEAAVLEVLKLYENNKGIGLDLIKVRKLYDSIDTNIKRQETTLKLINELETFYKKNYPEICPFCNTKLK